MSSKGISQPDRRGGPARSDEDRTIADEAKTATDRPPVAGAPGPGIEPRAQVQVPDHQLLTCIGRGSYGEVWLARNVMGTYRAVKIVYRAAFEHARPFEREFNGIQKFEPISRSHDGFVDVLQIGRTPEYFYYVMELADDVVTGQQIDPATYEPKTLRSQVQARRRSGVPPPSPGVPPSGGQLGIQDPRSKDRLKAELHTTRLRASEIHALPFEECVELGLSLTAALSHLHGHGLIHRDIKPLNIIFVNGIPKLADIGLVAEQSEAKSFVGTEGFIPPEGPGTPQADIYSLGKVLYEMATGKDRHEFPALPTLLGDSATDANLLELNSVFLKACQSDVKQRYQTAGQMREDLLLLRSGKSVQRAQSLERQFRWLRRLSAAGALVLVLGAGAFLLVQRQARREAALRKRAEAGELQARRSFYANNMLLAHQALLESNLGRTVEFLEAHVPSSQTGPNDDLRGWEWRWLWKISRSGELFPLGLHSNTVMSVAYSPDGNLLASGSVDGTLRLWSTALRTEMAARTNLGRISSVLFSPDGRSVGVVSERRPLRFFDPATGQEQRDVFPDGKAVVDAAFSPQEPVLAVIGDNSLRLWDWPARRETGRLEIQEGYRLAYAPNGTLLAAATLDGSLRLLRTKPALQQLRARQAEFSSFQVHPLGFSPDSRNVLTAGGDDPNTTLIYWDVDSLAKSQEMTAHGSWVSAITLSPDGRSVVTASADHTVKFWEPASGRLQGTLLGDLDEVRTVAISPDGTRAATGAKDGWIRIWKVPTAENQSTTSIASSDTPVISGRPIRAFAADGSQVLVQATNGVLELLDTTTGEILRRVASPTNAWVALSTRPARLATVTPEGAVSVLGLSDDRVSEVITGQSCQGIDLSADGHVLAMLGTNWTVQLWQLNARPVHRSIALRPTNVFSLNLSARGNRLAVNFDDGDSEIWDASSARKLAVLTNQRSPAFSIAFFRDDQRVAIAGADGKVKLWDYRTGRPPIALPGTDLNAYFAVALSPDERRLVAGGSHGRVRLWDVASEPPREVATFLAGKTLVSFVGFSSDGNTLSAVCRDSFFSWRAPAIQEIDRQRTSRITVP